MNERIYELAVQAKIQMVSEPRLQEFAELIIQEMLQTCEDHPTWTGRMIGEQIKQHFGVEE